MSDLVLSSLISVLVALYFAYADYGVWALVVLHLTRPLIYTICIWFFSKWLPSLVLSKQSLVKLSKGTVVGARSVIFKDTIFENNTTQGQIEHD